MHHGETPASPIWNIPCLTLLLPVGERLIKVHQCKPIPNIIVLDLLYRLLTSRLADRKGLDDGFDILLTRELQHRKHLRPASDMAASNLAPVGREVERLDLREGLVGQTDIMELAVDVEGRHEFLQVEGMSHVGSVKDEVKGESPWFGPVFVLGADELLCAELEGIFFLVGAVRDGIRLCAESGSPKESEVAESTALCRVSDRLRGRV